MSKIEKKIGLIGVGNMGSSILEGLLKVQLAERSQLWVYDKASEKARAFAELLREGPPTRQE